jgi:hypothetical protein
LLIVVVLALLVQQGRIAIPGSNSGAGKKEEDANPKQTLTGVALPASEPESGKYVADVRVLRANAVSSGNAYQGAGQPETENDDDDDDDNADPTTRQRAASLYEGFEAVLDEEEQPAVPPELQPRELGAFHETNFGLQATVRTRLVTT